MWLNVITGLLNRLMLILLDLKPQLSFIFKCIFSKFKIFFQQQQQLGDIKDEKSKVSVFSSPSFRAHSRRHTLIDTQATPNLTIFTRMSHINLRGEIMILIELLSKFFCYVFINRFLPLFLYSLIVHHSIQFIVKLFLTRINSNIGFNTTNKSLKRF